MGWGAGMAEILATWRAKYTEPGAVLQEHFVRKYFACRPVVERGLRLLLSAAWLRQRCPLCRAGAVMASLPVAQKSHQGTPEKQKGPDAMTSEPLAFLLI